MSGAGWSVARVAALVAWVEALKPVSLKGWEQVGAKMGISGNAARLRYRDYEKQGRKGVDEPAFRAPAPAAPPKPLTVKSSPAEPAHPAITVTKTPIPRVPVDEMWARAEAQTAADVARHLTERVLDVTVEDGRPIAVAMVSDQHIRQSGPIQLPAMRQDAELIRHTPGLFAMLGGDGVDNHIKHRSAMVGGGSKVAEEWRLYDHYLGMFGEKILAVISGNHDDWTRDEAGVDMVSALAAKNRLHYAPDEVRLDLTLQGQVYHIALRHQYRYNSSFNLIHAVKRLWEMGGESFDIGVLCHHHEPAIEPFRKHGRTVWGARPGSYQVNSSYGRRYGFNNTRPTCPTFVLFPDTHRIEGFLDVWSAANYLRWLREGWPGNYRRRAA